MKAWKSAIPKPLPVDDHDEAHGPSSFADKPLPTITWTAYEPPAFVRAFIDSDAVDAASAAAAVAMTDAGETSGRDAPSYLPPAAAAFLASEAGDAFKRPTPCQALVWPLLLGGRDVLCVAPTGTGKTLAYLVPALEACAESARRWKQGHADRKALLKRGPTELGGRGSSAKPPSRSDARFLGFSQDPGSPCRPAVLVVVPTRELAAQVGKQASMVLRAKGLRCVVLMGGAAPGTEAKSLAAPTPTHMMVSTPGRLVDLLHGRKVDLLSVVFLVVDEADRLLLDKSLSDQLHAIGTQLRPDAQAAFFSATLPDAVEGLAKRWLRVEPRTVRVGVTTEHEQTATNSRRTQRVATASGSASGPAVVAAGNDACDPLRLNDNEDEEVAKVVAPSRRVVSALAVPKGVAQVVHVVRPHKKAKKLLAWLSTARAKDPSLPVLVFCNTIAAVLDVTRAVNKRHRLEHAKAQVVAAASASVAKASGPAVAASGGDWRGEAAVALPLHGKLPQAERELNLRRFAKSFKASSVKDKAKDNGKGQSQAAAYGLTLVATDVAARGLHLPGLHKVLNFDFPPSLEQYVHRIGRVGRMGQDMQAGKKKKQTEKKPADKFDGGEGDESEEEEEEEGEADGDAGFEAVSFFSKNLAPLAPALVDLLRASGQPVDDRLLEVAKEALREAGAEAGSGAEASVAVATGEGEGEGKGQAGEKKSKKRKKGRSKDGTKQEEEQPASTQVRSQVDIRGMVAALLGEVSGDADQGVGDWSSDGDADANEGADEEPASAAATLVGAATAKPRVAQAAKVTTSDGWSDDDDDDDDAPMLGPVGYKLPPWLRPKAEPKVQAKAQPKVTKGLDKGAFSDKAHGYLSKVAKRPSAEDSDEDSGGGGEPIVAKRAKPEPSRDSDDEQTATAAAPAAQVEVKAELKASVRALDSATIVPVVAAFAPFLGSAPAAVKEAVRAAQPLHNQPAQVRLLAQKGGVDTKLLVPAQKGLPRGGGGGAASTPASSKGKGKGERGPRARGKRGGAKNKPKA